MQVKIHFQITYKNAFTDGGCRLHGASYDLGSGLLDPMFNACAKAVTAIFLDGGRELRKV